MAERSIFKGAISLGGFVIPIRVSKATNQHDVKFHEYHAKDLGRVGRSKPCKVCGALLSEGEIMKGVEVSKDNVISFTEAEMENIPLKSAKTIDIDRFVEAAEITPVMLEEAYYVLPNEEIGAKAYEWFVKGLKREHKVAIGKVCLRQREHICVIAPMGNGLVLNTMFYADEVREMPQPPKAQVTDGEVDLICQVIGKFSKPFEHTAYTDEYTKAIQSMIDAKLKGEKITKVAEATPQSEDLESALRSML